MRKNKEHENYLLKSILSNSLSSENPSKDAYNTPKRYFNDLKEKLLLKYENKSLKDIEGSSKINTDYGETYKITHSEKIDFKFNDCNFQNELSQNLKLVPGIGINSEEKLKNQGFNDIKSLLNHDKYSNKASKINEIIENNQYCDIFDLLKENKYSKKCKNNVLKSAAIADIENFKFMDIETLGLSNVPIILIGVAEIKNNKIESTQYLLEDKLQEMPVIDSYLSHLDEDSIHVTFNGASFDVPFIKNRCRYYNLDYKLDLPHLDLLYFARQLWKNKLPNCKLTTIEEEIFNINRVDDVPGSEIPGYYETYLEKNNIGPLVPIIEHNRQDIVSLASFLMKMYDDVQENS